MEQRLPQRAETQPFDELASDTGRGDPRLPVSRPVTRELGEGARVDQWLVALSSAAFTPAIIRRLLYTEVCKRALDVLVSIVLLLALLPLLLVIAAVVRLSGSGHVLYRQQRIGRAGRPFTMYKFRTMIDDRRRRAEGMHVPERRQRHKSVRDPRVTRIGRVLRRTSLDELPQLLNVLRGDMSLVGPRPELPKIVEQYEDWQQARHLVRPGMTGWWQVNGRSALLMHEHAELDIFYVEHVSLWLDVRIMFRTLSVIVRGCGAH